jgi:putative FmdB family regulatory protein
MPIYDYRCADCGRRSTHYYQTFSAAAAAEPRCPHCQSANISRLVSRVAVHRSEESRLDDMADESSFGDVDENDPKSVARWARKMGQQFGEDLGDDWGEMVDQIESGAAPEGEDGAAEAGPGGMDDLGGADDGDF